METMSSQFTKAWPQTDVFNAHSLPRSQTTPQHGAISPQDSQKSWVGAAEHPWVQGQQKRNWKKPQTTKEKKYGGKKKWKKPRCEGHFGAGAVKGSSTGMHGVHEPWEEGWDQCHTCKLSLRGGRGLLLIPSHWSLSPTPCYWCAHECGPASTTGAVDHGHLSSCRGTEVLQAFWHKVSCWHLVWRSKASWVQQHSVCVCVCSYAWEQERDTEWDKELTQTLLWAVWACWGSSKYQERGQMI